MLGKRPMWVLGILAVLLVPFGIDWTLATARLDAVMIETSLDPLSVIADGKHGITVTVRVTEKGRPRGGDLLQSWVQTGSGLLIPEWTYTDDEGVAEITFAPSPLTQYDLQDRAEITVRDLGIGRLIEVGKEILVKIPLVAPEEQEQEGIMG